MQRDARFFADPERFDPDRWTPEFKAALPKFAYFPFGGGPRQCIGESFAWMELVLLVATIAQRWRFRSCPGIRSCRRPLVTLRHEARDEDDRYGIRIRVGMRRFDGLVRPPLASFRTAARRASAPSGSASAPCR